jgi:hypothetical protein
MWTVETEYLSAERKAVTGNCIIYGQGGEYIATVPAKVASVIAEAPAMVAALRAIVHQRDHFAECGKYNQRTFHPGEDQAFDDWAADIAETILSRIDGAGEALPDAPAPNVAALVASVLERGRGGDDVEQYTLECARDAVTELEKTGQAETAKAFAQAMAEHIGQEPEAWPAPAPTSAKPVHMMTCPAIDEGDCNCDAVPTVGVPARKECASKHFDRGDDICADCGADLS